MQHKKINLHEENNLSLDSTLECFIIDNFEEFSISKKRPGLLILPGGGYDFTSNREAEPIALKFLSSDISCFVLRYKTKDLSYPAQIIQAAVAINIIRKSAHKWNIDENQIYAMGFSAGGHLCGHLGTIYKEEELLSKLGFTYDDVKLNGMILCYPVVTLKEFTHEGTKTNLTNNDPHLIEKLSIENRITELTPRTFIWHTYDDETVPLENVLLLSNALRKNNIKFELHIYEEGVHGLSVADETSMSPNVDQHINKPVQTWINLCTTWIKKG